MVKKIGRPTDDPKTKRINLRITNDEYKTLEEIHKETGKQISEIIRKAITEYYDIKKGA